MNFMHTAGAAVLIATLASPAAGADAGETLSFGGSQAFSGRDDPAFADPSLDDSGWTRVPVPCEWMRCEISTEAGIGWYRLHFALGPARPRGDLGFRLGAMWGAHEVYLNGERIGGGGEIAGRYAEQWAVVAFYALPARLLRPGNNVLALRVLDTWNIAGLSRDLPVVAPMAHHLGSNTAGGLHRPSFTLTLGLLLAICLGWLVLVLTGMRGRGVFWVGAALVCLTFDSLLTSQVAMDWGWVGPWFTTLELLLYLTFTSVLVLHVPFAMLDLRSRWATPILGAWAVSSGGLLLFAFSREIVGTLLLLQLGMAATFVPYLWWRTFSDGLTREALTWHLLVPWTAATSIGVFVNVVSPWMGTDPVQAASTLGMGLALFYMVAQQHRTTRARVQALSERLVHARDEERRNLARELHDGIGQELQALRLGLQRAARRTETPDGAVSGAADSLSNTIESLRALSRQLYTHADSAPPLPELLEHYVRYFTEQTGTEVVVGYGGERPELAPEVTAHLLRILQEALGNAVRHGGATRIDIHVASEVAGLRLRVSDDGRGFEPQGVASDGIGLGTMRERAAILGGTLSIDSSPDGTVIDLLLPA